MPRHRVFTARWISPGPTPALSWCSVPADQQDAEPLWGSGGNGIGASIILLDNQVVFTVGQNALVAQAVAPLPAGAIAGGDFVHVLGTIDLLADTVSLYINNAHWPTARRWSTSPTAVPAT